MGLLGFEVTSEAFRWVLCWPWLESGNTLLELELFVEIVFLPIFFSVVSKTPRTYDLVNKTKWLGKLWGCGGYNLAIRKEKSQKHKVKVSSREEKRSLGKE